MTAALLLAFQFALPGDLVEKSISSSGQTRWYAINEPMSPKAGAPVVILLHGGTQSYRKIFAPNAGGSKEWLALAKKHGFWLVCPNGTDAKTGDFKGDNQNWNDLRETGESKAKDSDDVAFVTGLIDAVVKKHKADPTRVYVTGSSNGGMMTQRLLIEKPEKIAAGAAIISSLPASNVGVKKPSLPTPILLLNGTKDPLVKWDGGQVAAGRGSVRPVLKTLDFWLDANRVGKSPAKTEMLPDADPGDGCMTERKVFSGSAPVEFWRVENGGHALPSIKHRLPDTPAVRRLIGAVSSDYEGAEICWEYLKKHRRA